jgi:purine-binding chemotaxis protein CheW
MSKSVDETVFDYFSLLLQESSTSDLGFKPETNPALTLPKVSNEAHYAVTRSLLDAAHSSSKLTLEPQTSAPKVSTESAITRVFAEPRTQVDKFALEKLLSAVSTSSVSTSNDETGLTQQIKASAERVRQATTHIDPKTAPQASTDHIGAQKKPLTGKEIKPLVDIKNNECSLAGLKDVIIKHEPLLESVVAQEHHLEPQTQTGFTPPSITHDLQGVLDDEFQVLFFKVAGLTLAVPLVSLGGIIKIEKVNHLIGRPSWFMGVQTHRDSNINVVDTCAWVMPEKYSPELAQTLDYQYLVMLEDSQWGLTCESLVNAVKIDKLHVNWREKLGKRPWLAGVVKQQMCGILHVQALIEMLDAGLGCQDSIDRG